MTQIILILNKKIYKKKYLNWGQIPPLIILHYDSKLKLLTEATQFIILFPFSICNIYLSQYR
jgi:hypothetical protein